MWYFYFFLFFLSLFASTTKIISTSKDTFRTYIHHFVEHIKQRNIFGQTSAVYRAIQYDDYLREILECNDRTMKIDETARFEHLSVQHRKNGNFVKIIQGQIQKRFKRLCGLLPLFMFALFDMFIISDFSVDFVRHNKFMIYFF